MFPIPSPIPTWKLKVKIVVTGWIKAIFKANAGPPPYLLMNELRIGIEVMEMFIFILHSSDYSGRPNNRKRTKPCAGF